MSHVKRLSNINALRAIAAISVCWFHFTWHEDATGFLFDEASTTRTIGYWGLQGVYIFFVISGMVIPLSLYHSKYALKSFFQFVAKRLVRLHPPYLMSMGVLGALVLAYALKDHSFPDVDWFRISHHLLFTAPFVDVHWIQDVYWTLSIEFQYYLLIGLMFPLLFSSKQWLNILSWVFLVVSASFFGHDQKFIFFFHGPVFALGIALCWHHLNMIGKKELMYLLFMANVEIAYELGPETMWACVFTCFIVLFVHWHDRVSQWLGDISYSVYLTHGFTGGQLLWFAARYCETEWQKWLLIAVSFAVTIAFAAFFYWLVEKPSVRWSQRIKYKPAVE